MRRLKTALANVSRVSGISPFNQPHHMGSAGTFATDSIVSGPVEMEVQGGNGHQGKLGTYKPKVVLIPVSRHPKLPYLDVDRRAAKENRGLDKKYQ